MCRQAPSTSHQRQAGAASQTHERQSLSFVAVVGSTRLVVYTVSCEFVAGAQPLSCCSCPPAQVDLPAEYSVTTRWTVAKNWLFSATLNSPLGVRPKTSLDLSDMFEDSITFRELRQKIEVQPRHSRPRSEEVGPGDSVSQVGAEASSSSSQGDFCSPAKLTPKQLQSALARLARKTITADTN